jgi:hypothetical protein
LNHSLCGLFVAQLWQADSTLQLQLAGTKNSGITDDATCAAKLQEQLSKQHD